MIVSNINYKLFLLLRKLEINSITKKKTLFLLNKLLKLIKTIISSYAVY